MSAPLHKTGAIILRTVKFGETSLVVTAYTDKFGVQSYIVSGVRLHSKKGSGRANLFQPAALLEMVVYHRESTQLNRIKDFQWRHIYTEIFSDVRKNAVALFMVELAYRCVREPEQNEQLFGFLDSSFLALDKASETVTANLPLYFALHLATFLGLRMDISQSDKYEVIDLSEGSFVSTTPTHREFIEGRAAQITATLLKTNDPAALSALHMNQEQRRDLLHAYEKFYALHLHDFLPLRTVPVLRELW